MGNLDGQVAIVTGSATGIGYGIAERLSNDGANIIMVDFDAELAEQSGSELAAKNVDLEICIGDVANPETAQEAVRKALDKWGRIDILIKLKSQKPKETRIRKNKIVFLSIFIKLILYFNLI